VPTVSDIQGWFAQDLIPIAMILKQTEKEGAQFRCTRQRISLNGLGWKVSHLDDVGLGRATIETVPIPQLQEHFRRFIAPGNMFLMPLEWSGLAEVSQMIAAIRAVDAT
jgi:hypothetical protein